MDKLFYNGKVVTMDGERIVQAVGIDGDRIVFTGSNEEALAMKADERIMQEPAPFIALKELASSSVDFTVRVWTKATDYWNVFFETNERIYAEFNKQGIKFPFPQLQIHQ